jgi:hypothetical protein
MLGGAQQVILIIFVILLIVIFGTISWAFIQGDIETWPPTSQPCPDYWTETESGICKNITGLNGLNGNCSEASYNFSNAGFCDKYNWSNGNVSENISNTEKDGSEVCGNVSWDGINYGYGKYTPCDSGYNPGKL